MIGSTLQKLHAIHAYKSTYMLKSIKYIWHNACRWVCVLGLVCSVMCGLSSCGWHEAEAVVAMADSIDQTQHVIYDDTTALGCVIRKLDNPFGRLLMSNTLGKAYYYMGRNYSLSNQIADAADCYIEADRLQIDDLIYRGRVNSNIAYICAQNNSDSLALIFYERAGKDFRESGNEWRYAQNVLDKIEFNVKLHNYIVADSLLQIAEVYSLDSAYQARYYETRGLYFYEQQQYDSALVYFQRGLDYWQSEDDKCFSYLKIMQIYFDLNELYIAIPYAKLILSTSNNPNYISNAYYCFMQSAEQERNITLVSNYASSREDMNRLLEVHKESYTQAVTIIEDYKHNPYPFRWAWITISFVIILCVLLIITIYIYRKFAIAQLKVSNEQIVSLSACIEKQKVELDQHSVNHNYNKQLDKIRRKYPIPLHQWNEYDCLKKDINIYLQGWLVGLEKLRLTNRENVFCVLIFIYPQMSADELAGYLCITKDAVLVRRARIAKKIGVTSAQLSIFLQCLMNPE